MPRATVWLHAEDVLLDIQLSSAHNNWPELRDATLRAEDEGYDTTWVLDHFDGTVFPGGDRDVLECCTLLGALAAATSSIGIGTLVANVANRHPAVLAAALVSAQRISGGRVRAGIGAGAAPDSHWAREHHDRSIPLLPTLSERHAAVVEQISILRSMDPMPVIVGVNSNDLATVAGLHADGVNVRLSSPKAQEYVATARDASDGRAFEVSGWAAPDDHAARAKAEALDIDRLILARLEKLGG
jgi:alkanesulfonate monooxygenase SsuD/methylene tetrahydromethanopterin reductase-like flavin-dependent oxidoreductase (luciferase family)